MDTHSSSSPFLILARTLVMCNLFGVYLYECLAIEAAKIKFESCQLPLGLGQLMSSYNVLVLLDKNWFICSHERVDINGWQGEALERIIV